MVAGFVGGCGERWSWTFSCHACHGLAQQIARFRMSVMKLKEIRIGKSYEWTLNPNQTKQSKTQNVRDL